MLKTSKLIVAGYASLVTLGWCAFLVVPAGRLLEVTAQQASQSVAAAAPALGAEFFHVQSSLERALRSREVLRALASVRATTEGPLATDDQISLLKVAAGLPSDLEPQAYYGVTDYAAAVFMKPEEGQPLSTPSIAEVLRVLGQERGAVAVVDIGGEPFIFLAGPNVDGGVAPVIGAPLVGAGGRACTVVKDRLALQALGVAIDGKLVTACGDAKSSLAGVLTSVKSGVVAPFGSDRIAGIGPISLPLGVPQSQVFANVAGRTAVGQLPIEVVAIASTHAAAYAVAQFQKLALIGLVGVFVLAVAAFVLVGAAGRNAVALGVQGGSPSVVIAKDIATSPAPAAEVATVADGAQPVEAGAGEAPIAASAEMGFSSSTFERSPDDAPQTAEGAADPAAMTFRGPSPFDTPAVAAEAEPAPDPFADTPTSTYPPELSANLQAEVRASKAGPAAIEPGLAQALFGEEQPEDTLAYPISGLRERLGAEANVHNSPTLSAPRGPQRVPSAAAAPAPLPFDPPPDELVGATRPMDEEDVHFRQVFEEFLALRTRCGEPADGITYDKFTVKLRKNKEQLVQKYGCRTVRFQVYEKEGKAALKASPVR